MVKISNYLSLKFESSLTDICSKNESFDSAVLRICYPGLNRNGSYISKEDLQRCLKSIYNCPVVCNYNREDDTFGGHDVEIVERDGSYKLVNLTNPVGVIPESANVWFDDYEEDDGTKHEYLFADVLLWKRQEAYDKIKNDGIIKHSMEIMVKDGELKDGIYNIYDFEFTAFALIGCEPCFEGSALETFSNDIFKKKYMDMMKDLKNELTLVNNSEQSFDIHPLENIEEEGGLELDNTIDAIEENDVPLTGNTEESFNDNSVEETIVKSEDDNGNFALESNIRDELISALSSKKAVADWGEYSMYWYVDHSPDKMEVYAHSNEDWKLYGFSYKANGDSFVIDFESKKRMKFDIVDFDEGEPSEPACPCGQIFDKMDEMYNYGKELEAKLEKYEDIKSELDALKQYKADIEAAEIAKEKAEVIENFSDLSGNEEFTTLIENVDKYTKSEIEEKCFAIRGKNVIISEKDNKSQKIKIEKNNHLDEPYGGLFFRYGYNK